MLLKLFRKILFWPIMTIVGIGLSPLIPYTHCSALSVHSSYQSLVPSPHPLHTLIVLSLFTPPTILCCPPPHPLHTLTALSLFTPPTNFSCPPLIPCTYWQHTSLFTPPSTLCCPPLIPAYPDSTFSFQTSYHSLLPFPHPLHNLTVLYLFTAPTTLWFSPLIPIAHPHCRALCLYLQLHPCHPNHWNLCSILCLFW